ncbi:hypothetical protein [Roseovarius phycicola]|uniref:Uncharacterized protein n=1 Tax=Roseovarius phycicola TaxID=3080976 RepID=A0ABZ2HG70_9RHOB
MRILPMITLGVGLAMIGGTGIGIDYTLQKQKAEGTFDAATYIDDLFDRFGNQGGFLGLIFRDSAAIDIAMPEPPVGWEAWYIDESHLNAVFSNDQWRMREREFAKVESQVPEIHQISETDQELWWAYFDDTSTAYVSGDNVILLFVSDKENEINQPVLRKFLELSEAHFASIETRHGWRSFNGQPWEEVEGPVTQAENGVRPHELRMFETKMGSVSLFLETRASEQALSQFLENFDLSGLRRLGNANAPKNSELTAEVSLQTEAVE